MEKGKHTRPPRREPSSSEKMFCVTYSSKSCFSRKVCKLVFSYVIKLKNHLKQPVTPACRFSYDDNNSSHFNLEIINPEIL